MPPQKPASNIRAFARWRESNVYAGEEIECIITFKNIAPVPGQERKEDEQANGVSKDSRQAQGLPSRSRGSSIAQGKAPAAGAPSVTSTTRSGQPARGHRPALSLNVTSAPSRGGLQSAPIQAKAPNGAVKPATGHGRSLSIMSLGSDVTSEGRGVVAGPAAKRPLRGHGRSASLHTLPRQMPQVSPYTGGISPRQPSPLFESTTPPALAESPNDAHPIRPARRRLGTMSAGNTPHMGRQNSLPRGQGSGGFNAGFQFPGPQPGPKSPSPQPERSKARRSPSNMHSSQPRSMSPRPPEGWSGALSNLNPITRVMSESSTTGTPRTSSEFYSVSNHSDETVTSELPYQNQQNGRLLLRPTHSRQTSNTRPSGQQHRPAEPETLMMGYAQTMGYFILDSSLVNAAPFEEVKRKGVQGGGGVVGVEKAKRNSGMFGAFSWGNIGESLGALLVNDEMSSMAQMKASAGSKSIPLLSTPQNLLFVDLRLAPGESRSYDYRFSLPRGLPPSYRGRAIKVFYHLALGIQRPEGQAVKRLEIPFRVLGSYNARGEALGHDLMAPYILLQDAARSTSIADDASTPSDFPPFPPKSPSSNQGKPPKQGLEDFLRYTERLLEEPKDVHGPLASPTSPLAATRKESLTENQGQSSIKEAVDLAILRANYTRNISTTKQRKSEGQSSNRFNIARAGHPVAVLTLLRPAYRLGEAVVGTIDFTAPAPGQRTQTPSYAVLVELESAERVDPSLALRSANSITRVTRKIHSSARSNALFARSVGFSLAVPATATPTFETTGVGLVWRLRVEFTVERQEQQQQLQPQGESAADETLLLLEEIGRDERGTTAIARERLQAETFEIEVPLKVLGVPALEGVVVGGEVEGLEI